ncbi:MAG: Crp/Fnr family transcriptional regulator [Bacteroidota bacterium]
MNQEISHHQYLALDALATFFYQEIDLPKEKFELIRPLFEEEDVPKGSLLIRQEGYSKRILFLRRGYVRCYFSNGKKEFTHWVYWKGHIINDIPSFYNLRPSKWNFMTLSDCQFFAISQENYQKINHIFPDWDSYEKRFIIKFFSVLENRISTFLSMNSRERYESLFEQHPQLFNRIPLVYIASMLGMAPETLSRIRSKAIS